MSRRNRIFLGILVIFTLGVGALLYRVVNDLDTRYRESTEESLVDTAHLLAALVEADIRDGRIEPARLGAAFANAYRRRFDAQIFGIVKHRVDLRAYVTDANGTVLFDSTRRDEGKDFRAWRDVNRALAGEYGARTTPDDPLRRHRCCHRAGRHRRRRSVPAQPRAQQPARQRARLRAGRRRIEIAVGVRHVDVSVRDHGPGVPTYALGRVFDRFYSLRRPDSGRKSTGLGLPFVREIAHLHGGEASLANASGGGAVALLRLPRHKA